MSMCVGDGTYLAYIHECENKNFLDKIVRFIMKWPEEEVDLETICEAMNIDIKSLTKEDIEYIITKSGGWAR